MWSTCSKVTVVCQGTVWVVRGLHRRVMWLLVRGWMGERVADRACAQYCAAVHSHHIYTDA